MEEKGYLESEFGEKTATRGGKRKKFFSVTATGKKALNAVKEDRDKLWSLVHQYQLKVSHV